MLTIPCSEILYTISRWSSQEHLALNKEKEANRLGESGEGTEAGVCTRVELGFLKISTRWFSPLLSLDEKTTFWKFERGSWPLMLKKRKVFSVVWVNHYTPTHVFDLLTEALGGQCSIWMKRLKCLCAIDNDSAFNFLL